GADALEVEYKEGYEEVVAMSGVVGHGIARLRSSSAEAASLRRELDTLVRRKVTMTVDGQEYAAHCRAYESFGERAYKLELRRLS
ncbi:MAG TPA: hypothetical protein VN277_01695, partial [Acidiferrobacterales bacterium]|nr:hypothetical protein [Acidiferrobacterales bacterium]